MRRINLTYVNVVLLVALAILIQLVPYRVHNPPVSQEPAWDSAQTEALAKRACYDCHSHETRWPWYSRVAPLSWWIAEHVEHGRGDLNFSQWPVLDFEQQEHIFRDIDEQIEAGEMPLKSYLLLHREARLSDEDRQVLRRWAQSNL